MNTNDILSKKSITIVIILILIIIILVIIKILYDKTSTKSSIKVNNSIKSLSPTNISTPNIDVSTIKWITSRFSNIDKTIKSVLDEQGVERTNVHNWTIFIPYTYDNLPKQINDIPKDYFGKKIFMIDNADLICRKDTIWSILVMSFGRDITATMLPPSYTLTNLNDLALFEVEFNKSKLYIMKKNLQRQEGLLITNNKDVISRGAYNEYVIVQELLQDPYTISGRKINLRFYFILIFSPDGVKAYVYNDGFMYYTREQFIKGSMDDGPNITTGYIDRQVYKENPLTHMDFRQYLDNDKRLLNKYEQYVRKTNQKISDYVFNDAYSLFVKIVNGTKNVIRNPQNPINNPQNKVTSFQLFGADVAINDKLKSNLMEINKGPDLDAKDERDKALKLSVVTDMFRVLEIIPGEQKGFIKLTL